MQKLSNKKIMKFCVLGGAGHIGSGIVRELNNLCDCDIVVADLNIQKAENVAKMVDGEAIKVDVLETGSVKEAVRGCDVVLSAVGPYYRFGKVVLKAVIEAGKPFVDVDDDYDATKSCLELSSEAEKAGVTAIIGLGATPGITNVLARYGYEKMDSVDAIDTYWAWTSLDPTMGPAIIAHYFHASDGMIPTYRDGKWIEVQALSDAEIVEFPEPLGCIEVYNVGHPEPVTIPRYLKVNKVTNKGTVWPEIMAELTKYFSTLGFTSLKKLNIGGVEIAVRDIMVTLTEHIPEIVPTEMIVKITQETVQRFGDQFALYGVGIATRVSGEVSGEKKELFYGIAEVSAVKATALPAALGAVMLAEGKIEKSGVYAPEGIIPTVEFLKRLSEHIKIMEVEKTVREIKL
ncbi:saccharopine dehydrogenase NADP-binding domain-containing protein [Archaeoglobus sp.]